MEVANLVSNFWPLITAFIGLIVWLVRLEGKGQVNERDIARNTMEIEKLNVKHESLDSKVVEQLATVKESLARIEGALGVSANKKQ
ncbi:hypothetical protein EKK58_08335 [Candidatus Dependentiae bacterium]|jgi:hypothetical protein|nr:MAG: hypothetical protein EKK58_08335 [Candidatus Dependentiae bacterium]